MPITASGTASSRTSPVSSRACSSSPPSSSSPTPPSSGWVTGQVGLSEPLLGVAVMGVSAVANLFVSRFLFRVAKRTDSAALEADAWHHEHRRLDLRRRLRRPGPSWPWPGSPPSRRWPSHLDPSIALIVAAVIFRAAWDITRRSWDHLVDRSLPAAEVHRIEDLLREHYPQIVELPPPPHPQGRLQREIDLHLVVPGELSVADAHQLCDHLEDDLHQAFPGAQVLIHVEPEVRRDRD